MGYPHLKALAFAALLLPGLSMASDAAIPFDNNFRAAELAPFATQGKSNNPLAMLSAFGNVASMISTAPELQKELDATLVNVHMVVRFVDLASSSSSFLKLKALR